MQWVPRLRVGHRNLHDTVFQIPPCLRPFAMDNLLWGALEDDLAARGAAVGAHVDNPVGLGDEFEAMLYDDDGITLAHEAAQEREQ